MGGKWDERNWAEAWHHDLGCTLIFSAWKFSSPTEDGSVSHIVTSWHQVANLHHCHSLSLTPHFLGVFRHLLGYPPTVPTELRVYSALLTWAPTRVQRRHLCEIHCRGQKWLLSRELIFSLPSLLLPP